MKRFGIRLLLTMTVLLGVVAGGESTKAQASVETDFIESIKKPVVSVSHQNHLYASVMMAQAILESDWGQSELAVTGNNYFGIKGSYNGQSVTMATAEYSGKGKRYVTNASFKKYPNVTAAIKDNASLLRHGTDTDSDYYSGTWTDNTVDYRDAAAALSATYATDMAYGNKLTKLIQKYDLTKLDTSTSSLDIEKQIADSVKDSMNKQSTKTVRSQKEKVVKVPKVDLSNFDKTRATFKNDASKIKIKPLTPIIKLS
ncbi:mannosyl-glycoprotein endo-beta-N-acetylglucosaminidase [Lentilactobacillus senioris DSM 24302 = JCM 17472]|uniref:Mannosyl-glycoprotein endo-beta-N-acetylglucosaminidase n=1 Tax=Lentilactobacillus senioris DSM 24302 = JCM 17472 TaxID=1423802 RepID=A0A0R2CP52_9LACO|nr:glucosaminidase domain-containing protein [Lentilactobacillus senioris]KRM93501.1 mannosyl-glycoprotein endo-beta-N-acetylglucosaminidase [Lentilactobacillus senioris DSM 24302 = JCM 17472]